MSGSWMSAIWFFGDSKIFRSQDRVVAVVIGTIGCRHDVIIWRCHPYMIGRCVSGQRWWWFADVLVVVGEVTVGFC